MECLAFAFVVLLALAAGAFAALGGFNGYHQ